MTAKENLEKLGMKLRETPEDRFHEKRRIGLALKAQHDKEMIPWGEPHPYTGEYQMRPRSVGVKYDIPPNDGTYCPDQVDQEGKDAVNINTLMAAHDPSGKAFNRAIKEGMQTAPGMFYDDYISAPDFQEAQDNFNHATQQFQMLDAQTRNRFENDPVKFLKYVADPSTLEEQYKMGIRVKPNTPEPDATNKDVIKAIQQSSQASKKVPKGGESED